MENIREPDTIIRFLNADHDDPDRQMALRITNFLGGLDVRRAVAVYSLAMSMSFRGLDSGTQTALMKAIVEACLMSWAILGKDGPPCQKCGGAGMIGDALGDCQMCEACEGKGQ